MYVDTHAHIDFEDFNSDRETLISRAWDTNVRTIIIPGIDKSSMSKARILAEETPHVWFAAGYHPHNTKEFCKKTIIHYVRHPKCVAIGEIGLDYYRNISPKDTQEKVFIEQLEIARNMNLPVIIHVREAWQRVREILEKFDRIKGVLHGFSGSQNDLEWAIERGFYLGLGGPITFKNFKKRDIVSNMPSEKILTETDCPYLAPQSHRGKRNEPSYIPEIAEKISDYLDMDKETLFRQIIENTMDLFDVPYPKSANDRDRPKGFLSQNYLIDKNITEKIVSLAGGGKLCVEIGAGHGELTSLLDSEFERLWAIEPDWDRMESLKKAAPTAIIIPRKFQEIDLAELCEFDGHKATIVGNLPYGETTPILFRLFDYREMTNKMIVMVQKEFADRLTAKTESKEYGIPTVIFSLFFDIKREFDISQECFRPRPAVKSTVLTLVPKSSMEIPRVNIDKLRTVIKASFAHRRKTIRNSLRMELPNWPVDKALEFSKIFPDCRAESIYPEAFIELTNAFTSKRGDN